MNKQFMDGVLETLRDDERQICKQAARIIGELAAEIDGLQSLNDFQQQQISCMQSDIDKMKCCGNCGNTEFDGGMGSCCKFDDLRCEGFSHWELKK